MMEIKLRAWINALNCWADEIIISQVGDVWGYIAIKNDNKYFNAELEQFTGLRDKNGKEIYEGDIVRAIDSNTHEYDDEIDDVVSFIGSCFSLSESWETLDYFGSNNLEVIGNIHENQELLK